MCLEPSIGQQYRKGRTKGVSRTQGAKPDTRCQEATQDESQPRAKHQQCPETTIPRQNAAKSTCEHPSPYDEPHSVGSILLSFLVSIRVGCREVRMAPRVRRDIR
jgi:hypothetical protein